MVLTNDAAAAARMRSLRSHGATVSDFERHSSGAFVGEEYPEPGYNFRMTDVQAAIGLAQFAKLGAILEMRRALAGLLRCASIAKAPLW